MAEPPSTGPKTTTRDRTPHRSRSRLLERAPFRAWLVTGPPGRLAGFILDFARALRAHHQARRERA